jgi:hypothetical protein
MAYQDMIEVSHRIADEVDRIMQVEADSDRYFNIQEIGYLVAYMRSLERRVGYLENTNIDLETKLEDIGAIERQEPERYTDR